MRIERGPDPDQVRQSARHTLFVEGSSEDSIDYQVLSLLLKNVSVTIKPAGNSYDIRSIARALRAHHSDYYFLVDRDHQDPNMVEHTWQRFPDADTDNLLIWRRREIENYFFIPEYLAKSQYLKCSRSKLKDCIVETIKQRIFLDVANLVILKLKQKLKQEWIELFDPRESGFDTEEKAIKRLLDKQDIAKKNCDVLEKLDTYPIMTSFTQTKDDFLGGQDTCLFSQGCWLEMVKGKYVLPIVIDKCFRVKDTAGKFLQGNDRMMEVVKDLVRLPLEEQPDDFRELHNLIANRVRKG